MHWNTHASDSSKLSWKPKNFGLAASAFPQLRDLITTGPVERGFYVVSGGRELNSFVQDSLVDLLGRYLSASTEYPGLYSGKTEHPSRRVSQIGQIIWVDSGNRFDPYRISIMARKRGLDPHRILRSIKVGRPFTAFQLQQMLDRVPNPALVAYPETSETPSLELPSIFSRSASLATPEQRMEHFRAPNAVWWTPLVIISDLMNLFYDPELPEADLHRAFQQFEMRLSQLRNRAIVVALLHEHNVPLDRKHLLPDVMNLAKRMYSRSSN